MVETLNLSGEGTASDAEVEAMADEILALLKEFKSPKDAGSAFMLAHYKMIMAVFPPAFRAQALDAINCHHELLTKFINEGWQ